MNDTCTIFGSNIIARDNTESTCFHLHETVITILAIKHLVSVGFCVCLHIVGSIIVYFRARLYPWHQLVVMQTYEVCSLVVSYDSVWHKLLSLVVFGHFITIGDVAFWIEIGIHASLCHNQCHLLRIIWIIGFQCYIVNIGTYAECRIGW